MQNSTMKKCFLFVFLACILFPSFLPAQEALKSVEEDYYDFLSLQGLTERPTFNYRTFSDSTWSIKTSSDLDDELSHLWQEQNLGTWSALFGKFRMRAYGPELFMSGNTAAPYGQNDGLLWQGRGFNALLKGGVRFEGYGIELTLLPHFAFSQNVEYEIMPSVYKNEYGYFWGYGIDAPQRFGDEAFFDWDFGDSEIRYTWKTLTIGFGAQTVWLGPSYLNSMLHSNNAPAYPKFDFGLRRQRVTLPWLNWYMGEFEARVWVGKLSESAFFDNDSSNNNTMFHGLALSYAPSFLPGLTVFANRVCLVPWEWENLKYIIPVDANTIEDQKSVLGISWIFPQVGFEIYGEIGFDDYVGGRLLGYIRYPNHTVVFAAGLKKTVIINQKKNIYGMIIFEFGSMEMSQDFQYMWPYSFYFHHQLTHGYTNRGQILGNGTAWAGNSQYLEFKLFYNQGTSSIYLHRNNPDNNYFYSDLVEIRASETKRGEIYYNSWKSNFAVGINTEYFIKKYLLIGGGFVYNIILNPIYYYNKETIKQDEFLHNFSLKLKIKYQW